MRYAAKTDKNHAEIRDELRKRGYIVFDTSKYGDGMPDLIIISKSGRIAMLFEVKTPENVTADKIKNEVKFMMQLVHPVYRWVFDAETALQIMMSID